MPDLLSIIDDRVRAMTQKDLAALHPEILDREHIASLRSDVIYSTPAYSYLAALGDYETSVWVRKAVTTIANNYAPLPRKVSRDGKFIDDHPLSQLLSHMNSRQSSADVNQQWVIDMLLGGEEGWELTKTANGQYAEVFPRQPHIINVIPDAQRLRYLEVAGYEIDDQLGESYKLPPDEFVHFKFYNPKNPWRGLSVISAIRMSISIDQLAQAWERLLLRKGGKPDYAVITPEGTTKSEREEYEIKLAAQYSSGQNTGRPIALERGIVDIKPLDWRPRDMAWLSTREVSRDEIGGMFGVPDILMGFGNDTYDTEVKRTAALGVLFWLTILPLAGYADNTLTEFFRRNGALKPNEAIVTDTSQVAALKADLKDKIAMWTDLTTGGMPSNAASEFLGLGLPRYKGDDIGYLPVGLVAVTGNAPAPLPPPSEGSKEGKRIAAPRKKSIEYNSIQHREKWETFVAKADPHEKKLGKAVAALFEEQQAEVLAKLKSGKAVEQNKGRDDVAENPFDRDAWEKKFRDKVKPILRATVQDAGASALTEIGVDIAFDVLNPAVVEFLNERTQRFAEHVNETTWQRLKASLSAGLDSGESLPELMARVESVMGDRIRSSGETIARTEITGTLSGGQIEAYKQSEAVEGIEWLAALDDRTRPTHIDAHGQQVALGEDFEVGGCSGPGPGLLDCVEEVANCRCSVTAILSEKARIRFSSNGHGRVKVAV